MEKTLNRRTTTVADIDAKWRAEVKSLEHALYRFYNDLDEFSALMKKTMEAFHIPYADERVRALKIMNALDEQVFDAIIATQTGRIPGIASALWDRLLGAGLIVRQFSANTVAHSDRVIDHVKLARHLEDRTLHNLFFPPAELMRRYSEKIVAIDVLDDDGESYRGSGFVVGKPDPVLGPSNEATQLVVTCRHNLEGKRLQSVTTGSGSEIEVGRITFSDQHDIAFMQIGESVGQPPLTLTGEADVFDEVFTLGFPKVPRAESTLLGHRGEVNSKVARYMEKDEVLIISNLVAPGSSGGPVLDRAGRCVGMTVQWLEANYGDGTSKFSAALPRSVIVSELINHGLYWR